MTETEQSQSMAVVLVVGGSIEKLLQKSRDFNIEHLLAVPSVPLQRFLDERQAAGNLHLVNARQVPNVIKKEEPANQDTGPSNVRLSSEDELQAMLDCSEELTHANDDRSSESIAVPPSRKGKEKAQEATRRSKRQEQRYQPIVQTGRRQSKQCAQHAEPARRSKRLTSSNSQPVASSSRRQLTPPSRSVSVSSLTSTSSSSSGTSSTSSGSQSPTPRVRPKCPFEYPEYREAHHIVFGPRRSTSPTFDPLFRERLESERFDRALMVLDSFGPVWTDHGRHVAPWVYDN